MNQYDELKKYMQIFGDNNEEFEDELESDKPLFLQKNCGTINLKMYKNSLQRIRYISQFCGCDYTSIYNPKFFYSRFNHSFVVANMTWHFTHDRKATIAALLHDLGTPCFAHTIDYLLGDYQTQETSEKSIVDMIKNDEDLINYLKLNEIGLDELDELLKNYILENKSPRLCTDRLDGVLGTCYIWLHTHSLEQIKEVYDDLCVLINEDGEKEIGFNSINIAEKFGSMVSVYAHELQTNRDKFVMQYIADIIKESLNKNLFTINDLYRLKEEDLIKIFRNNFESWQYFEKAKKVESTNKEPINYSVSIDSKHRNVIPLVKTDNGVKRLNQITIKANKMYDEIGNYQDKKYGYVKTIKKI